jgi:hypothetical protein
MKISIERSGGFAGIARRTEVDTSLLAPEEARRIEGLVRAAARARPSGAPNVADAFEYRIAIDGRHYVVRDPSEEWGALIDALPENERA